jgi:hypothetical protein
MASVFRNLVVRARVSVLGAGVGERWRRAVAVGLFLIGVAPQASIAQTASLPGKFGVSAAGAATYVVPISVPPGTSAVTPSLSLEYNSQAGASSGWLSAGIVVVGWQLGGLPAVG